MKPMENLIDEETDQLALMFEIAPRFADAYRLKNEFLTVISSKSSSEGKQKLADWLLAVVAWICLSFRTAQRHITTGSAKS